MRPVYECVSHCFVSFWLKYIVPDFGLRSESMTQFVSQSHVTEITVSISVRLGCVSLEDIDDDVCRN